jgi:hypothetical protein
MKRGLIIGGAVVALGIAWALFRPELLLVNRTVNEPFPGGTIAQNASENGGPKVLSMGQFRGLAHKTDGSATLYEGEGGRRTLRLESFATSNGPALHVYLVAAEDAKDNETVKRAGFIDLGPLKGNKGDQNYDVPAGVNLEKYRSVSIWCARFGVNFATAPLAPGQS